MLYTFNNISASKFELNGYEMFKTFIPFFVNTTTIRVINIYDSKLALVPSTDVSEIEIDGNTYPNATDLITALAPVIFAFNDSGSVNEAQIEANRLAIVNIQNGIASLSNTFSNYYNKTQVDNKLSALGVSGSVPSNGVLEGSNLKFKDANNQDLFTVNLKSLREQGITLTFDDESGKLALFNVFGDKISEVTVKAKESYYDTFQYVSGLEDDLNDLVLTQPFQLVKTVGGLFFFTSKNLNLENFEGNRIYVNDLNAFFDFKIPDIQTTAFKAWELTIAQESLLVNQSYTFSYWPSNQTINQKIFGAIDNKDIDSTLAFTKLSQFSGLKTIKSRHYLISSNITFDDNIVFEKDVHIYIKDNNTGITIKSTLGTSVEGNDTKIHVDGIGYTGTALTYEARGLNGSTNNETRKVFRGFSLIRENYGSPNVTADLTGKGFQISLLAKGEINTAILWMDFDIYCEGFQDAFKIYGNAPGVTNMFLNSCKFNITSWWCRNTLVVEQNTGFDITMCHFDLNVQGFSKIEKVIKEINNFDSNPIIEYSQFSIALWDVEVEVSDANVISNLIDKGYGCVYKSRSGEEISRYMAGKTDLMPYVFMDGNHNRSLHTINVQKEIFELYFKNIGDSDSFEASCVKLKDNIEDKGIMHDFDFRLTLRDGYVVYAYQLKLDNFLVPDIFNRDSNTVFDINIAVKIYAGEVSNIIVTQQHHQGLANNNYDEIITIRNCKFNSGTPYASNWRILGELSGTETYLNSIKNNAEIDINKGHVCFNTDLNRLVRHNGSAWVVLEEVMEKKYTAIISQSGTAAPTVTVLENTIGAIVWTRTGIGNYVGTLTGAFTANKTVGFIQHNNNASYAAGTNTVFNSFDWLTSDTVRLETTNQSGTAVDSVLKEASIEIKVYL